jgi:hypothetical protein
MADLRALRLEEALPAAVRGPVDFLALARLAASCFSEISGMVALDGPGEHPSCFYYWDRVSKCFPVSG